MILITSAAYIAPSLIAEFVKMPPCMLPVQNRRLYRHQIELLKPLNDEIVLSLPEDYAVTEFDRKQLEALMVRVVSVPNKLTLGASIVYVLNVLGRFNEPLRILHGDTLMKSIPLREETCTIAEAEDDYKWASVKKGDKDYAYSGYFSFSSQATLIRCITEANMDFIAGVKAYMKEKECVFEATDTWLDFGLVNSYYRSKSKMTTQRSFNDLTIDKYSVTKRSRDSNKILAEANWISSLPPSLKHFVPALWESGIDCDSKGFYTIEYFYLNSLADLYVFGNNPLFIWERILNACVDFIDQTFQYTPDDTVALSSKNVALYRDKTIKRISKYAAATGISLESPWQINGHAVPSLLEIVDDISRELDTPNPGFMHIMHGDFCFSNILYDFKSMSIKVLDPRGRDMSGDFSIYGDIRYDVSKLAHSVIGMYDFIIGGLYDCLYDKDRHSFELSFPQNQTISQVQTYFMALKFGGYSLDELSVYPILIHLFLSMLPLHGDNPTRQEAMLANALRLYRIYKKNTNRQ